MRNFTDEDYKRIGRCLKRISNDNNENDIMELHMMFKPLINKCSYNLFTKKFSAELNNELNSKVFEIIIRFKI